MLSLAFTLFTAEQAAIHRKDGESQSITGTTTEIKRALEGAGYTVTVEG